MLRLIIKIKNCNSIQVSLELSLNMLHKANKARVVVEDLEAAAADQRSRIIPISFTLNILTDNPLHSIQPFRICPWMGVNRGRLDSVRLLPALDLDAIQQQSTTTTTTSRSSSSASWWSWLVQFWVVVWWENFGDHLTLSLRLCKGIWLK